MPCALNEKYLGPSTLPLYFYFGHQVLEEMGLIKECGPVKKKYNINTHDRPLSLKLMVGYL